MCAAKPTRRRSLIESQARRTKSKTKSEAGAASHTMFSPPKIIDTTVFAKLPEEFKWRGGRNEWVEGQPLGMPSRSLLEGPSFDQNGNFYCVDAINGRIYRVSANGEF